MLPALIPVKFDVETIERLYGHFHQDFVANTTNLNGTIRIDPRSHIKDDGKEKTFWHLVTSNQTDNDDRHLDRPRAERLSWVKAIIEGHSDPIMRCFYHRENNPKKDLRYYLWAHKEDFVVILQKLGKSSVFLVTSFYVTHEGKRRDYQKRYTSYRQNTAGLAGCEWF